MNSLALSDTAPGASANGLALNPEELIVQPSDLILITGSAGFVGSRVVDMLLAYGFHNLRCLVRTSSDLHSLKSAIARHGQPALEVMEGNLLSPQQCEQAVARASIIYHLAAGVDKSFPGAYMNSVVATRNLLDAALNEGRVRRFVNVSSFAVYSSSAIKRHGLLTEEAPLEPRPDMRGAAYAYGKIKQDELVLDYARRRNLPVTIVRPGSVFGPGRTAITGRVGIDTFGVYIHLGGSNTVPLTYVDNCADAIVLAGLKKSADGQIFNVTDDDLPTSRQFLRMHKSRVRDFRSIYIPYPVAYLLCLLWETYSHWSKGQLPPVFNRSRAQAEWKGHRFSNRKLKDVLGWQPRVSMPEALNRYFAYQQEARRERC